MKIFYRYTQAKNGGYGVLGKAIAENIRKFTDWELIETRGSRLPDDRPDILLTYGMPDLEKFSRRLNKRFRSKIPWVHYFVWESSKLPREFVTIYKRPDLLLTSTNYISKCVKKQGLRPVVWHHGVDARFKYEPRTDDGVFTFLHHNAYEFRKGWENVLHAFTHEFGLEENVRLIMKARERQGSIWLLPANKRMTADEAKKLKSDRAGFLRGMRIEHPQVEEIIGHVTDEEMVAINNRADCFVFPAKGEGWGLPPFEAAAMGIVPIIPNQGSFKEWFNKDLMIENRIAGYINAEPRYTGTMFYPSTKDLRKKMRWAFENENLLQSRSRELSEYIHKNFGWKKVIEDLQIIFAANL